MALVHTGSLASRASNPYKGYIPLLGERIWYEHWQAFWVRVCKRGMYRHPWIVELLLHNSDHSVNLS